MRDESFKVYVLEQLGELPGVTCRPMFGGYGLYRHEKFFGIISGASLFFKTDARSKKAYRERGMKPFAPSKKQVLKNYYEVPPDIIEDRPKLAEWALDAASVQNRGRAGKR